MWWSKPRTAATDTGSSGCSFILAPTLEHLILTGTATIDGQGNGSANRLIGNSGNNGLDGGGGGDYMAGGLGNDTYTVDHAGDVVIETPGGGTDIVRSTIHYILGIGLENSTLLGTGDRAATGNELHNVIAGNAGANVITGGLDADMMSGGAGDWFFYMAIQDSDGSSGFIDSITDFLFADGDRIDLSLIDADETTAGDQAFVYQGIQASFTGAGQIRAAVHGGAYRLYFNTDANLSDWGDADSVVTTTTPQADWLIV